MLPDRSIDCSSMELSYEQARGLSHERKGRAERDQRVAVVGFVSRVVYVRVIVNTPKASNTRAEGSAQRTLGK